MNNEQPPDRKGKFETQMITCPKCGGTGKANFVGQVQAVTCPTCKGKGQIAG